jgi:myo-inositol 2-dehydrogenase/D-chiro-inositol 1-dehydrogenase
MVWTSRPSSLAPDWAPQFYVLQTNSGILVDIEIFVDVQYGYDVRAELVMETGAVSLGRSNASVIRSNGMAGEFVSDDWNGRFAATYRPGPGSSL